MAGKPPYLLDRDGRYFARLTVPKRLRPFMGGLTERREALGPDRRLALKRLPGAVAQIQHEIAPAEKRAAASGTRPATTGRYPLSSKQISIVNYQWLLGFDEELRNHYPAYAQIDVDDLRARELRKGYSGALDNDELEHLVGDRIERYRALGTRRSNVERQSGGSWRETCVPPSMKPSHIS